ncbi:hypothetical protein ACIPMW_29645 [Streptomyces sp. NPDC086669]|uniref:hypothetical protein n=1 Tax=Streptomyces sp. NPDC086669 TaxID=3365753 RepID=UPI0038206CCE
MRTVLTAATGLPTLVLSAALVLARSATRPLVRRLHRLFPDEPGPAARRAARTGTPTLRTRDRAV